MKLQANNYLANFFVGKMLYRTVIACLLIPLLFSATAGSGPAPAQAYADPGTIAYVRDNDTTGDEIRLIEPDGSNDRLLWRTSVPDLPELYQISELAWNPAATELAFASRHEEACSFYNSDIYTIRSDGSGYRRVTAPPACGQRGGLPTGTVNVYLDNWTGTNGPFVVYFQGAPRAQTITLAPGSTAKVTFTNVADYGNFDQWAVVILGQERYTSISGNANVIPGGTVDTDGYLDIGSFVSTTWGWTSPTWRSDGSELSFAFDGTPYSIPPSSTAPGMIGSYLFDILPVNFPSWASLFAWAPAGPRANQVLYGAWPPDLSGTHIYLGTPHSTSPGNELIDIGEGLGQALLGLAWLPDSSGFLYSQTEGFNAYANIFEYSFDTGTSTRLTDFTSGYPWGLTISPDGTQVVYEYQATGDWMDLIKDIDLWRMDRSGNGQTTLFVENARAPAWSPASLPGPIEYDHFVFMPMVLR